MIKSLPYPTEYVDSLQDIALGFLRRHQAEHLGEQELFSRAVRHLVITMQANKSMAENVVARAYGELTHNDDPRYLDISASTSNMAMLVDPRTGMNFPVPVNAIFDRMINPNARARLSVIKTTAH